MQSTFPVEQPSSQTAPAFRPLEVLLSDPHTAISIAAALAMCDHPKPSRASFQTADEHAISLVTWCACCGASAHTALGVEPAASDWIRTTLAHLVTSEQLAAVEALALGLRELEHSIDAESPMRRSDGGAGLRARLASFADAVRSFARSPALAGVERLGAVGSRLADTEEPFPSLLGW
jgi:hypothetical protein